MKTIIIVESHTNTKTIDLLNDNNEDVILILIMTVEKNQGMITGTIRDIKISLMLIINGVLKNHHQVKRSKQVKKKNPILKPLES